MQSLIRKYYIRGMSISRFVLIIGFVRIQMSKIYLHLLIERYVTTATSFGLSNDFSHVKFPILQFTKSLCLLLWLENSSYSVSFSFCLSQNFHPSITFVRMLLGYPLFKPLLACNGLEPNV